MAPRWTVTLTEVLLQHIAAHVDIVANAPVPIAANRLMPGVWVLLPLLEMLAELG